jgi:hypothetical protein
MSSELRLDEECVHGNTTLVSLSPKELEDVLDELEASRKSRRRAWDNLQEIPWVLKDTVGIELPAPKRKTKDGVRTVVKDRQLALGELLKAIREFRKFTDEPLTLGGGDYAHAVRS